MLYLLLGGGAGADDGLLDFARRIFEDLDVVLKSRTDRRRARMPQFERTACVLVHEHTLDHDDIRRELLDDAANAVENLPQAVGERTVHAADRTAGYVARLVTVKIEHAETRQA